MKNAIFLALAGVLFMASACTKDRVTGSGSVTTENRTVGNFTAVRTNGSTSVTIVKGNTLTVAVKGYGNLLPYFDTKVVNGTLLVGYQDHVRVRNDNTEVTVTMPVLSGVAVSGSGNITSTGNFTGTNDFEATISGSGNINMQAGKTKNFESRISGSGDIHAFGFSAENANVQVSGSGNTRITATNQLRVKISGSGNVYYKGSPDVSINVSGSGGVIKQ